MNDFFRCMTSFTDAIIGSKEGVLLCLHVAPGSSQTVFPYKYNQWRKSIEIKVTSIARDNKANTEVRETLARFFQLTSNDVIIVDGEKSREKTVCLRKIPKDLVIERLQRVIHE